MEIKLKAGKRYKICSCGLSQTLPFCDNAHREFNTANNTEYKSLKITPDSDTMIEVTSKCWESPEEK
jgi:CDGSH-type Zn-finger protein|tara:strand:+ start:184 stop:384 length:201 start_codon:yes stop_codon:yes gene_type:complete